MRSSRKGAAPPQQATLEQEWFAWEPVVIDEAWLVSYVDLLSILLAALVILLGQAAVTRSPPSIKTHPEMAAATSVPTTTGIFKGSDESKKTLRERWVPLNQGEDFATVVGKRFDGEVSAVPSTNGVSLEIAEAVLFDSAQATLRDSGTSLLSRLAAALKEIGAANIAVEGHTDDRAVQNRDFPSNWVLAAARASTVTHFLIDQGITADSLRSVSYADTRPIADNGTEAGRAANRRVELQVEFISAVQAAPPLPN